MATTLYLRNTANHVGSLGSHGNYDLEQTTGTTATLSIGANTPRTFVWYSATTFPNLTDWQTGTYTWYLDVTVANANVQLTSVKISRYDSTLTTEKASDTGTPNLTLNTTGVKSGTISFASPNPGNRAANDRLVVTITLSKLAGGGAQSVTVELNGASDSRLDTPLSLPAVRDISEPSVSIGAGSVATNEVYTKPISEPSNSISDSEDSTLYADRPITEPSKSISGSIEATKIPAEPSFQTYYVHFVEFPESISDAIQTIFTPAIPTEPVSTSKTHKFNILQKITASKTHKWNLIAKITASRTHLFSILVKITASRTHLFNTLAKISPSTKTHKYNIIGRIIASRTHKWHQEGQVISQKIHKWNILSTISTTKTHKYHIVNKVSLNKSHKYNIIEKVTTSKTHKYGVSGEISVEKTHKYNVAGVISQVSTTKTHKYDIYERILATKTHIFSVLERISPSKTHKYDIEGKITTSKTHIFSILQKITRNRTHKFNVTIKVTPSATKTHKYSIKSKVTRSKTHKFNIIKRITRTHTHRWNSGGKVTVTKRHIYDIGEAFVVPEGAGSASTLVKVKFPERIRIVDIISDIRNKAVANIALLPDAKIIICRAIVELADPIFPIARIASGKARHRISSRLIIPQVLDTIENHAVSGRIGIEELELPKLPQIQLRSALSIQKLDRMDLTSHTQIKQDPKQVIRLSSTTEIVPCQRVASMASLELSVLNDIRFKAPEIMSIEREQTIKNIITLLNNNELFK